MFERLKEELRHLREHREIEQLDDRELDEIGVAREDLHRLVDIPDAVARRMAKMAEVHGLSAEALDGLRQDYAELLEHCAACRETATCNTFLAAKGDADEAGWFCPNHAHFVALKDG